MIRQITCAILVASTLAACGATQRAFGIRSSAAGPNPDRLPTSVFGDWVLASDADSTAFAGARLVEMHLGPSDFSITASYPMQTPVVVRGSVAAADGGALTLTPMASADATSSRWRAMTPGKSFTVLASAAGGSLVFAPANKDDAFVTSVWHERAAAQAAGQLGPGVRDTTARHP